MHNPKLKVIVADLSESRIDAWRSDALPIYEPGLQDIVTDIRHDENETPSKESRQSNLHFTTNVKDAINESDIIFICVNTPTKMKGSGAGSAPNMRYLESAVLAIAENATSDKIIVEKSTVPVRTADSIRTLLDANARPGLKFDILSNPEFLAEGTAVRDLLYPDRVLIGSESSPSGATAALTLENLYAAWVPRERIIHTSLWSSELAKLASNALLAQRISSINSLSAICEATGANVQEIAHIAGLDQRIGAKMLKSSVGFGGSCFHKDVLNLCYLAESLHLPEVAEYWHGILKINSWQRERFARRIIHKLNNTLTGKTIAVLGFAYKKDTGDTRESPAISVVQTLLSEGAYVNIYDPQVTPAKIYEEVAMPAYHDHIRISANVYEAATGAHALAILTEWDEFCSGDAPTEKRHSVDSGFASNVATPATKSPASSRSVSPSSQKSSEDGKARMDWAEVATLMKRPMYVFDGRNVVDPAKLQGMGFSVESIGQAL